VCDTDASDSEACRQKFQQRVNEIVRDVIRFAKFIPGFTELDLNDQISLLKGAGFEVTSELDDETIFREIFSIALIEFALQEIN